MNFNSKLFQAAIENDALELLLVDNKLYYFYNYLDNSDRNKIIIYEFSRLVSYPLKFSIPTLIQTDMINCNHLPKNVDVLVHYLEVFKWQ